MKYRIKPELKQETLNLLIERRATTLPRIKKIVLTSKEMYLAKWLKYFTLEELDYYLEPVDESSEFSEISQEINYEDNYSVEETTQKEVEEYYGI